MPKLPHQAEPTSSLWPVQCALLEMKINRAVLNSGRRWKAQSRNAEIAEHVGLHVEKRCGKFCSKPFVNHTGISELHLCGDVLVGKVILFQFVVQLSFIHVMFLRY